MVLFGFSQIKELKNNLANKKVERDSIYNDMKTFKEPIFYFDKFHNDKIKINPQNQGVFEDIQKYFHELYNRQILTFENNQSNVDQIINCPIEHMNLETMFNLENPYYTNNKLEINNDTI